MQVCSNGYVIVAGSQNSGAGRADTSVAVSAGPFGGHREILQRLQRGVVLGVCKQAAEVHHRLRVLRRLCVAV